MRVLGVSEFSPAEAKCGGAVRVSWLTSMRGACAALRRLPDSSVAELPGGTSLRWSTPAPTANDLRQELELTRFQVDRGSYATSSAPPTPTRPSSLHTPHARAWQVHRASARLTARRLTLSSGPAPGSSAVPLRKLAGGQHGSSGRRLSSDSSSAFGIELVEFVSNACKIPTSHSAT